MEQVKLSNTVLRQIQIKTRERKWKNVGFLIETKISKLVKIISSNFFSMDFIFLEN